MHDFFRRVTVSEQTYDLIRRGPEALRHRLDHLIEAAAQFYANCRVPPSARIRHLDDGLYKMRVDRARRIPFHFTHEGGDPVLHFGDIGSHEAGVAWHTVAPEVDPDRGVALEDDPIEVEYAEPLSVQPGAWIGRVWDPQWDERARRNPDAALELALDEDQRRIAALPGPLLLRGGPGSGKTTIAIYRLLMGQAAGAGRQLYVTYTDTLRAYAEQQYDTLAEPGHTKPLFRSIPDLCRALIGPDHAARFPPERRMTAARFRSQFVSRSHRTSGADPDLCWEEIQAVIKGDPRLLSEQRPHLTRTEYGQSRQRIADDPEAVYRVFEAYVRSGWWDDLDLSRDAYWRQKATGSPLGQFDEIVVDEAQDLTGFQIGLLLALCRNQAGLFLAGDTQQAIHPSRFDWTRSRELLYRLWQLRLPADHIQTLGANYRNPAAVVAFCNAISRWRQETWQDEPAETQALKDGPPIRLLTEADVPTAPDPDLITSRLMVIAYDETAKETLQARFGAGLVFTVHEAKGLERDYVLIWRPFTSDRLHWEQRHYDGPHAVNMVNRLVVSLSRATAAVFVVDDAPPGHWPPMAELHPETGEVATTALREVFALPPDSEAHVRRQAMDLERSQHFEQAAALFERIREWRQAARCHRAQDRYQEAARCLGWAGNHKEAATLLATQGAWRDAALYFHMAGDHGQAADCFLKADAHREAVPHLEASGRLADAAASHERIGNWAKAIELYRRLDRPADLARCLEATGDWQAAAAAFAQAGQPDHTAMCLEMAGNLAEAAAAYEVLGDWRHAGLCREKLGDVDGAIRLYEKANAWWEAGHLLASQGQFKGAAALFASGDDPLLATACLYRQGNIAGAARSLELQTASAVSGGADVFPQRAGDPLLRVFAEIGVKPLRDLTRQWIGVGWQAAAALYRQANDVESQARCRQLLDWATNRAWPDLAAHFADAGKHAFAAGFHQRAGQWGEAAAEWEETRAFSDAITAYEKAGDLPAAERCRRIKAAAAGGLEAVATAYEAEGMWERAARVHTLASNWKRAALAWQKAGQAGLQRHLDQSASGAPEGLALGDDPDAGWPSYWETAAECFGKAKDKVNAARMKRLVTRARAAVTREDWLALAKDA